MRKSACAKRYLAHAMPTRYALETATGYGYWQTATSRYSTSSQVRARPSRARTSRFRGLSTPILCMFRRFCAVRVAALVWALILCMTRASSLWKSGKPWVSRSCVVFREKACGRCCCWTRTLLMSIKCSIKRWRHIITTDTLSESYAKHSSHLRTTSRK